MKTRRFALLLILLLLAGCGQTGGTRNLTRNVGPVSTEVSQTLESREAAALAGFSLELLKETWTGEPILISPLSVLSALGMAANGAEGRTREEIESVLGLPVERLNAVLAAWTANLPQEKRCRVNLANSLWIRDGGTFQVDQGFLETVAGWYQAEVFASEFDAAALQELNRWVDKNTHGMIPEILKEIPGEAVMYLVNALALEAEWETVYRDGQVRADRIFTTEDGREQPVTLMYSSEGLYLEDETALGFMKPYQGGRWAFAALLPEEGVTLEAYLASLTGERLHELLEAAEETLVYAAIPKFQCRYGANLSKSLKAMGMPEAFDPDRADFSGMGSCSLGPLYISGVLHETYLAVDEKGTRAGAATAVEMSGGSAGPGAAPEVYLDQPFLYMLVDRETNLPAFIGVVTDIR